MSDCCNSSHDTPDYPKRRLCPVCGSECLTVSLATVLHHVKAPWSQNLSKQGYYFCDDPSCEVAYFGNDDTVINKPMLRTKVGIKEITEDTLICYCFGVTRAEAASNPKTKKFIIEQTKNSVCSCVTSNPSGRCCLKDFPK